MNGLQRFEVGLRCLEEGRPCEEWLPCQESPPCLRSSLGKSLGKRRSALRSVPVKISKILRITKKARRAALAVRRAFLIL